MASRSSIRASDEDREQIVERLRKAAAEGRLAMHELEERIGHAFSAKTYGDLDALVKDLPRSTVEPRRGSGLLSTIRRYPVLAVAVASIAAVAVLAAAVAIASGIWIIPVALFIFLRSRGGRWGRRYRRYDRGAAHVHVHRW